MPDKNFVEVKVLDLPGAGGGCPCSDPTLSPDYAAMLQQKVAELRTALEEGYPGKYQVQYVDVRENSAERKSEAGQLLISGKYPPPLVVIDGVVKFAGSIQVKQILKEVGDLLV